MDMLQSNNIILTSDDRFNINNNNILGEKTMQNTYNLKSNEIQFGTSCNCSFQNQNENTFNNQSINTVSRKAPLLKKGKKIQKKLNIQQKSNNINSANNLYCQKKTSSVISNNKVSNSNDNKYIILKGISKNIKKKKTITNNSLKNNFKESSIINFPKTEKKQKLTYTSNSKNAKSDHSTQKKSSVNVKNKIEKINNFINYSVNKNSVKNKNNLNTSVKQNIINEKNKVKNIPKEISHKTYYTLQYKRKKTNETVKNIKINNIAQFHSNVQKKQNKIIKNVEHRRIIRSINSNKNRKTSINNIHNQKDEFSISSSPKMQNNLCFTSGKNAVLIEKNNDQKKTNTLENHNIKKKYTSNNLILNKRKLFLTNTKTNEDSFTFCDMDSENKNIVNIIKTNEFDINKPHDKNLKYTLFKEIEDDFNEDKSVSNSKIRDVIIGKIDAYKDIVESDKLNKIYYSQKSKNFFGQSNLKSNKKFINLNNPPQNKIITNKIDNNTLILDSNPSNEIEDFDLDNNYKDLCVKNKDDTNSNTVLLPVQVSRISCCKYFDENAEAYTYKEKIDNNVISLINDNNIMGYKINKKCHNVLLKKSPIKSKKISLESKKNSAKSVALNLKNTLANPNNYRNNKNKIQKNRNNFRYTTNNCPRVGEIKLIEIDDDSRSNYNIASEENIKKNDIIFDNLFEKKKPAFNFQKDNKEHKDNISKNYQIETNHGNEKKCIAF